MFLCQQLVFSLLSYFQLLSSALNGCSVDPRLCLFAETIFAETVVGVMTLMAVFVHVCTCLFPVAAAAPWGVTVEFLLPQACANRCHLLVPLLSLHSLHNVNSFCISFQVKQYLRGGKKSVRESRIAN